MFDYNQGKARALLTPQGWAVVWPTVEPMVWPKVGLMVCPVVFPSLQGAVWGLECFDRTVVGSGVLWQAMWALWRAMG